MSKQKIEKPIKKVVPHETKREGTGVVMIASGHPMYAHYAYNLAVSLRFMASDIKICLLVSGGSISQLSDEQKAIFSEIKEIPFDYYTDEIVNPFKTKLNLDLLTPYEKTLYLDVDMVWIPRKSVNDMIAQLDGATFQPIILNEIDLETYEHKQGDWFDYSDVKGDITKLYNISSEVMYFEKTDIFKKARKVYDDNKLNVVSFGGAQPDEPYFMVAMAMSEEKPLYTEYIATYWQNRYFTKMMKDDYVYDNFFLVSAGGNINAQNTIRMYNRTVGSVFYGMGIQSAPYKLQDKRNVLKKERMLL